MSLPVYLMIINWDHEWYFRQVWCLCHRNEWKTYRQCLCFRAQRLREKDRLLRSGQYS